jgi:hypothetical protein
MGIRRRGFEATRTPAAASLSLQTGTPTVIRDDEELPVANDWTKRSTAPSVVWAHNFDSVAEVDQFRTTSFNDPGNTLGTTVQWNSSDGFEGGGCVEITTPSGGHAVGGWWRPMAAFAAGSNGRSSADLACNGTVKLRTWANPPSSTENFNFRQGYYGHPTVQAAVTTWQGNTDPWDGSEFWLQFRVKMPASRWFGYNGPSSSDTRNPFGKLLFIDCTASTHESEIVIQSAGADPQYFNSTYPFRMYTSSGSNPNSFLTTPQGAGDGSSIQDGGPYETSCVIGGDTNDVGDCWEWPRDPEWITVLVHVIPGRDNQATAQQALGNWVNNDTVLEVWVARQSETSYSKVFENTALKWLYGDRDGDANPYEFHPAAFNSICPSAYMNNVNAINGQGWYQRYTQIIFSKDWIPCPGESAPAYWTS